MKLCKTILACFLSVSVLSCVDARTRESSNLNRNVATSNFIPSAGTPGSSREPQPPSVFLNTSYARPGGRTIPVASAREFQAALDSAKPGDVIALQAGATFEGNFTLPEKEGSNWIVIRSNANDEKLPSPGTRMTPAFAAVMPKLVSPNADAVITTAPGAHHYRFVGVEFSTAPGWTKNHGLILLGDGSPAQNSLDAVPHDLIIDRCFIHGGDKTDLRRAIALNSAASAVIDSYVSDVHEAGADSQAICGWNGPGPFKIVNNYLEAAGENIMFGGADPHIQNLVPSDIEIRLNHLTKPLSWMPQNSSSGKHWSVKNLFELKNARRIIVEGNVFENNWVDGQSGFAVLFTVRNQEGTAPWSVVEDVTFLNNVVRHTAAGINVLGRDDSYQSEQVKRVLIRNNLFEDVGGKRWGNNGRFLQIAETVDVGIDHNTVLHTGNIVAAYGMPNRGFVFTNNLVQHNEYGVFGDGASIGNPTLDRYFPGCVFRKNVIAGGRGSAYPADNYFPSSLDEARFADRNGGNYLLGSSSPYKTAATDGSNIGCAMDALKPALQSAQTPHSSVNAPTTN